MNLEIGIHDWKQGNTARCEVVRLLGVHCPEPEAQAVLQAVHDFKWLEAERAGFDVWAAIQPDCPLRSAAVHWARRYQPEIPFRSAFNECGEARSETSPSRSLTWRTGALLQRLSKSWKERRDGSWSQRQVQLLPASHTPFPYWATRVSDLPLELQAAGREAEPFSESPWLSFPCEQVCGEWPSSFALRRSAAGLQALAASPEKGSHVSVLPVAECCAVQITNVLLLGQFKLFLKNGQDFLVRYNATGESKVHALLQPFLGELFRTEDTAECHAVDNQKVSSLPPRFAAALKMMLQPGESVLSEAVQSSAVEVKKGFSFWSRTISVPAAALVVTNKRIALIAAELDGRLSPHGWTATLIPIRHVQSLQSSPIESNLVSASVRFGKNSEASMRFDAKHTAGLQQVIATANRLCANR